MVQGKTKGLERKASGSKTTRHAQRAATRTKKGQRAIAPKQTALVKQAALHKSLSAKINTSVERQMVAAASSGKLTIMRHTAPEPGASGTTGGAVPTGKKKA